MEIFAPHISHPTSCGEPPIGKRKGRKKKNIGLGDVINGRDPTPWLTMPTTSSGTCSHCFWAINDPLFDTSSNHALKQNWETALHLCENEHVQTCARHCNEPTKHVNLRKGHKPHVRNAKRNQESVTMVKQQRKKCTTGRKVM